MSREGGAGNWRAGEAGVMREARGDTWVLLCCTDPGQCRKSRRWPGLKWGGTGAGQEIALPTAGGITWCGVSVFGVTG